MSAVLVADGTTTNDFGQIYAEDNPDGMVRAGAIKNVEPLIGGNSMSVRVEVGDAFGSAHQTNTYIVTPTTFWDFETIVNGLLGVQTPLGYVRIEVKSTIANMHADYKIRVCS